MSREDVVEALIAEQGQLYSEEMGAHLANETPEEVFHWLIGTLMLSARIGHEQAVKAAKALRDAGFHTVEGVEKARRDSLVKVLNENGYARFDESTADYIRAAADLVRNRYGGDARRLRAGNADEIRARVQEVKGIGPAGADIFVREMQLVWDELCPVAGKMALEEARDLGLPDDPRALAELAGNRERCTRLVAALTRAALDGPADKVREAAA